MESKAQKNSDSQMLMTLKDLETCKTSLDLQLESQPSVTTVPCPSDEERTEDSTWISILKSRAQEPHGW